MENVNVGVIGLGTVGGGVVRALLDKKLLLQNRVGSSITLLKVFDKDAKKISGSRVPKRLAAQCVEDVVHDDNIDIVVELIGGIHPAREIILNALGSGKHVVTANKALIAEHGEEIFTKAVQAGLSVGFEASVGGAMPVIKILKESFSGNRISAIYGIVNGTCNFVMSRMADEKCSSDEALEEAKKRGIAEANPKLDIDGHDSCHKLCILAMLSFSGFYKPKDIYVEGIRRLDLQDIQYARNWGYDIKLLAIAKKSEKGLELRVHPTLIPLRHLLSSVKGEDNAVFVKGDMIGEAMVYGKGAGRLPAASSVIGDIMDISRNIRSMKNDIISRIRAHEKTGIVKVREMGDLVMRYYVRISTIDQPGVLASISNILAKNKISIATVSQKERKERQVVPIVMLTHEAKESDMNKALAEINKLKFIKKKSVMIRIER